MSKGPGRLEQAIADLFTNNPSEAFTVEEMARVCYPGLNKVEKKHRVAILRAAKNAAERLRWSWWGYGRGGYCTVFGNLCDLHSFVLAPLRVERESRPSSDCEKRVRQLIERGCEDPNFDFPYADTVAMNLAIRDGKTDMPEYLALKARHDDHRAKLREYNRRTAPLSGWKEIEQCPMIYAEVFGRAMDD